MAAYHADTVIRRANIITIDPALPRATATAVSRRVSATAALSSGKQTTGIALPLPNSCRTRSRIFGRISVASSSAARRSLTTFCSVAW